MPSLFKVLSLLAVAAFSASGALASPQPGLVVREIIPDCTERNGFEMCRRLRRGTPRSLPEAPSRERVPADFTNAQRLARHLPLKPPSRRSSARRAVQSPAASPYSRGYIQILSVDGSGNPTSVLGYVSKNTLDHTQYILQSSLDDNALLVGPTGDRRLLTLNSDIPSPGFLGLVQGREDTSSVLAQGSFNYLYLASTERTSPGATPQNVGNSFSTVYGGTHPAESAVWTIDPETRSLKAQWINPDGSPAPTTPFIHGSSIYLSGDPEAFHQRFAEPVQQIVFVYVPA
ncbi:hypothetical protein C8R43DRAFT_983392 [Mycena crocata]|nr:hypothetical protein C8R43DRAFT_983392 [Mycena crocata]